MTFNPFDTITEEKCESAKKLDECNNNKYQKENSDEKKKKQLRKKYEDRKGVRKLKVQKMKGKWTEARRTVDVEVEIVG